MRTTRLIGSIIIIAFSSVCALATESTKLTSPFSFAKLIAYAEQSAQQSYQAHHAVVPQALLELSYEDYHSIQFNHAHTLWQDQGLFAVQFLHSGFQFDRSASINYIIDGDIHPLPFNKQLFHYPDSALQAFDANGLGFAGFNVLYPLHQRSKQEAFAFFLGASYLQVLGRNQSPGISLRGLALDTGLGHGEEFPFFREFWIEKPPANAMQISIYALLDSRSISGAYRMVLHPRTKTMVEINAVLFARKDIAKLGVAPLNSMFLFAENKDSRFTDFRPEVHNSDGLQLHTGSGEWLWRPLVNRTKLNISQFSDRNPRGFGLFQRDRAFASYQDLDAHYQRRPSIWVQPLGDWGNGHIELIEIPNDQQINDNIISFWSPTQVIEAGQRLEFNYVLSAFLEHPTWPPGGRVEATRIGVLKQAPNTYQFVVDFNGGSLPYLGPELPVEAMVSCSRGQLSNVITRQNPSTGGWRLRFDFQPQDHHSTDLRAFLRLHEDVLTETWNYLWTVQ